MGAHITHVPGFSFAQRRLSEMAKKWIQGAIPPSHKGALHRALGVPEGQKIPESKMQAASKNASPRMAKMINLANTLKKMKPKR
jgi:hypothetical protein